MTPPARPAADTHYVGRYTLQERLGAGGMGEVFRAHDRLEARPVALKRITANGKNLDFTVRAGTGGSDDELRAALSREFRILASLRHPYIISVLDSGFDEARLPYYTMDLLENAETILEAARRAGSPGTVPMLIQLLQALSYLHRRGIIHRDLKPANVLVAHGQVTVLDFGVAVADASLEIAAGTLAYMAPEVIAGEPPSPQADLYAVGVMAFEMLTGEHPLNDSGSGKNLLVRALTMPPRMHLLEQQPQYAGIIGRLLAKDARDRYPDAAAVISALAKAEGVPVPPQSVMVRESFLQAAELIGRDQEVHTLTQAMDAAIAGAGSPWLVGGESGIGKSRLLEEIRTRALVAGALVLRGRIDETSGAPFKLWYDAVRLLALYVPMSDEDAAVLRIIVPDIGSLLGRDIADAPPVEPHLVMVRIIEAVERLVRATSRPIVVLVDDVHWARESLGILDRLMEIAPGMRMLVVASYRSDDAVDMPHRLPAARHLHLERLDDSAIARLGMAMLGDEFGRSTEVISLLSRETEGNAFFLVETVRAIAEEAQRTGASAFDSLSPRLLSGGMLQIVRRRLGRVAPEDLDVLMLAAIAGREVDEAVLADASNRPDLLEVLSRLADIAVLDVDEGIWRFAHTKIREAVLTDCSDSQGREYHARIARAIERTHGSTPRTFATLAHHWSAAGEADAAVHNLIGAAEQAMFLGVPQDSLRYGKAALGFLNCELPTEAQFYGLAIGAEMGKIMGLLAGRAPDALLDLPTLTDARHALTLDVLLRMQPAAHVSQQLELFALLVLKGMSLTLQHGNSALAPQVYATFAVVTRGMTGDSALADQFSRLAVKLDDAIGGPSRSPVLFLRAWFIEHWVDPLRDSLALTEAGSAAGFESNDITYGCFNCAAHITHHVACGTHLAQVDRLAGELAVRVGGRIAIAMFHCRLEQQFARALAGRTVGAMQLTDSEIDEARDLASMLQTSNHNQSGYYLLTKAKLHLYHGDAEGALTWATTASRMQAAFQGQICEWELAFYHALALVRSARSVERATQRERIDIANGLRQKLAKWAEAGAANFAHKLAIVDGELADFEGRHRAALEAFERASAQALGGGFVHHAALADECHARTLLATGDHTRAVQSFLAAASLYESWGARPKAAALRHEAAGLVPQG